MTPHHLTGPDTYNLRGHVHQLTISNETKKGHNLVCWHQKNYPYHTELVSWGGQRLNGNFH